MDGALFALWTVLRIEIKSTWKKKKPAWNQSFGEFQTGLVSPQPSWDSFQSERTCQADCAREAGLLVSLAVSQNSASENSRRIPEEH